MENQKATAEIVAEIKAESKFALENRESLIGLRGTLRLTNGGNCPVILSNITTAGSLIFTATISVKNYATGEIYPAYEFIGYGFYAFESTPKCKTFADLEKRTKVQEDGKMKNEKAAKEAKTKCAVCGKVFGFKDGNASGWIEGVGDFCGDCGKAGLAGFTEKEIADNGGVIPKMDHAAIIKKIRALKGN